MELFNPNKNSILNILLQVYKESISIGNEELTKYDFFKLFYENSLIDLLENDIFYINDFLEITVKDDKISYENFIKLIFFIYTEQVKKLSLNHISIFTQDSIDSSQELDCDSSNEIYRNELNGVNNPTEMSNQSVNKIANTRKQIYSTNNIIKVLLDKYEKKMRIMSLCFPTFKASEIQELIHNDMILFLKTFSQSIKNIFEYYCKKDMEKNIAYININDINKLIFDLPIFSNLDCSAIEKVMSIFLSPVIDSDSDDNSIKMVMRSIFDEKLTLETLNENLSLINLKSNQINFTYSCFILILACMGCELFKEKSQKEAINLFFVNVLELQQTNYLNIRRDSQDEVSIEESEKDLTPYIELYPESKLFEEAKRMQSDPDADDQLFFQDLLSTLDRELPKIHEELKSFQNGIVTHANDLYYNVSRFEKLKFPLNLLQTEINEMNQKKLIAKEEQIIAKAKKQKKPTKGPIMKDPIFQDYPDEKFEDEKYFGNKPPDILKSRLLKKSYKDILYNSIAYPNQIKEILIIPRNLPQETMEIILLALEDSTIGNFDLAIRKLERAIDANNMKKVINNTQEDIFLNLTFGSFYESLDLNLMALRYYHKAKFSSDKLDNNNPDKALVYCYLGSIFISLREYEWALRCYLKAKVIRENTIGGDTIDSSTVYNNLGVCCFYMQCYYPAKGYFQLSYEINKSKLGLLHQRTTLVKSNLGKLSQLNFSREFEYKSPALYNTLTLNIPNPKKGKK